MSDDNDAILKELVSKIQQFLSHQVGSNASLSEPAKESLSVASECIEQAFGVQKKPASNELLDIYKSHKQAPLGRQFPINDLGNIGNLIGAALGGNNQENANSGTGTASNPAQLLQNLISGFGIGGQVNAGTGPQGPTSSGGTTSSTARSQAPPPQTGSAPKVRKKVSEAERLAAESFKNQGNDFMKQDKFKEAYDCYTEAIDIDDNNAIYYSNRAAASSKLGDHHAALRDCQEAVEIDSTYSKAYGRMGLAYASLEDHQRAKEAYVKAVELDPMNESYQNNLKIAEDKLAVGTENSATGVAGSSSDVQNNMMSMLRSMMGNPEVMQMAMRGLQDPGMQNLILNGLSAANNFARGPTPQSGNQNPPQP